MNSVLRYESERAMFEFRFSVFPILSALFFAAAPMATAGGADAPEAPAAVAGVECGEAAAATVQAHYEQVRDIDARFTQTTASVALGTGAAASSSATTGHVTFAKPGKMRWAYETPAPSLVVTDGATLWIYDPSTNEAQRFAVTAGYLTGAALSFLLGEGDLVAEFEVSATACEAEELELSLVPRKDSSYEKLQLTVVRSTGEVLATSIVDLFGNVTTVAFSQLRTNTDPAPATFEFVPPADAQVIDLTQ